MEIAAFSTNRQQTDPHPVAACPSLSGFITPRATPTIAPIALGPQVVRLRPAPHCRTRIPSYSLTVTPAQHFVNWQQDPHGNWLARFVFPERTKEFTVTVDLIADMEVINPFDFFVEPYAEQWPFSFPPESARRPRRLCHAGAGRPAADRADPLDSARRAQHRRLPGRSQSAPAADDPLFDPHGAGRTDAGGNADAPAPAPAATRPGSWCSCCAISACRRASSPAISSSCGRTSSRSKAPPAPTDDFTDLHAWTEVYLPGAGWIGLDPTSGLLCGEGHLPVAATPHYRSAAPISGLVEPSEVSFSFEMGVKRIAEQPRVTDAVFAKRPGRRSTRSAKKSTPISCAQDVRLTMGGEPTFVSVDDYQSAEWNTAAVGPTKRMRADELIRRLRERFAPGGLLHYGQGKWYPGEPLPRWAFCALLATRRRADLARRKPDRARGAQTTADGGGLHGISPRALLRVSESWRTTCSRLTRIRPTGCSNKV